MSHNGLRALAGLVTLVVIAGIVYVAVGLFQGSFTKTVPVTVLSARAGLVMNADAKVKMLGVQVGKVASIKSLPNGQAELDLELNPSALQYDKKKKVFRAVPYDVRDPKRSTSVDIASTTVFGAKFVELVPPADPSPQRLHAGETLDSQHVTVEINTVFQQLTQVLGKIDPAKLNETLGAIATALNGRGQQIGQALADLDSFLAKLDPSLTYLSHDLSVLPAAANAYGDAASDLARTADRASTISQTIVDEQQNLDALLISTIGLADLGNDVVGGNRQALTDVLHELVPTTNLTNQYRQALWCALAGAANVVKAPPLPDPGIKILFSIQWGAERYRYPSNLPKVSATGGPQCENLPLVPPDVAPPYVVADVGANPWQYGNQQVLINSDALKQLLYGPIDGPPRNTLQIGQPG